MKKLIFLGVTLFCFGKANSTQKKRSRAHTDKQPCVEGYVKKIKIIAKVNNNRLFPVLIEEHLFEEIDDKTGIKKLAEIEKEKEKDFKIYELLLNNKSKKYNALQLTLDKKAKEADCKPANKIDHVVRWNDQKHARYKQNR